MSFVKQSLFAAALAGLPLALAAPTMSPVRTNILGKQTIEFVNVFSAAGCGDDDFLVALATNQGEIAGGDNCVQINSADTIPSTQQDDGSYLIFIQPTEGSLFGGSGEVVVRSPVQVDVENCGVAVDTYTTAGCFATTVQSTFFLQTCLQSDTACAPQPGKRAVSETALFARQDASCFSHGDTVTELANDQTT